MPRTDSIKDTSIFKNIFDLLDLRLEKKDDIVKIYKLSESGVYIYRGSMETKKRESKKAMYDRACEILQFENNDEIRYYFDS